MKPTEQIRAEWREHVEMLKNLPCENVEPDILDAVEMAIRRCPYDSVSDAVMQINGGWICGAKYDLCLAWLLQAGCIEPSGFGVFRVDRKKLPRIEVENRLADAITISTIRPQVPAVKMPVGEPTPTQWDLF